MARAHVASTVFTYSTVTVNLVRLQLYTYAKRHILILKDRCANSPPVSTFRVSRRGPAPRPATPCSIAPCLASSCVRGTDTCTHVYRTPRADSRPGVRACAIVPTPHVPQRGARVRVQRDWTAAGDRAPTREDDQSVSGLVVLSPLSLTCGPWMLFAHIIIVCDSYYLSTIYPALRYSVPHAYCLLAYASLLPARTV